MFQLPVALSGHRVNNSSVCVENAVEDPFALSMRTYF